MPQPKSSYQEVRIPLDKMSFSPDVPATALGPNEYNSGLNVECDVRGMRSVAGDRQIFDDLPGEPTYISGGYRQDGKFWTIVAVVPNIWLATDGATAGDFGMWHDITPSGITSTYTQDTNITEAWSGTIPIFNDTQVPPMFWPESDGVTIPDMILYSNQIPLDIASITAPSTINRLVTFVTPTASTPFVAAEFVTITGANPASFNGTWKVAFSNTTTATIECDVTDAYIGGGVIAPQYSWNYNPEWNGVTAGFIRLYNTPNVGSILVAGNLSALGVINNETFPTTFQWSQAFGLNEVPTSWTPTLTNVANQLEIPVRGAILDAFPSNGNLYVSSYWDTVVFSPINFSTTNAPILGVRPFTQGRGLLNPNTWAQADQIVYGIDARDIWIFNGQQFQGLGNQRVKNWFYDQLDPEYYSRVYMVTNTEKNQIEIYYPDSDATDGVPNKMLSYRYDLDVWNAPREVTDATFAAETPVWIDNGDGTWSAEPASRTVMYAGVTDPANTSFVAQRDVGYSHVNGDPIESSFRRDNIKLLPDYSGKLMVHRVLPEAVNLGAEPFTGSYNTPVSPSTGSVELTLEGANSVGQSPQSQIAITVELDSNSPWAQFNQNAYRVNSIELGNTSDENVWSCAALTWQFTQVEDDR